MFKPFSEDMKAKREKVGQVKRRKESIEVKSKPEGRKSLSFKQDNSKERDRKQIELEKKKI